MAWWNRNQQQPVQQNGMLALGGQQPYGQPTAYAQTQNPGMGMGMGAGMGAGMGMGYQQPQAVAPPSEMELISALIQTSVPIDRWMAGPTNTPGQNLQSFAGLISNIVAFTVHDILNNAKITENKEGDMVFDLSGMSSVPSQDSITMNMQQLQNSASTSVQESTMKQQQIANLVQNNMMQGALSAAMANEGLMDRMASLSGKMMGNALGTGRMM